MRLAWRPANLCVLGHVVKVWAVRHLRTEVIIGEAADPEAEPLVFEEEVTMLEEGEEGEGAVDLGDALVGCLFHRVEVGFSDKIGISPFLQIASIYPDGQKSAPLSKTFKTPTDGNIASLSEGEMEVATSKGGAKVATTNPLRKLNVKKVFFTQRCYVGLPAVAVDTLFHTIFYRKGKPFSSLFTLLVILY